MSTTSQAPPTAKQVHWQDVAALLLIAAAFLAVRGPLLYRTYAAMDEECYAVPGITVFRTGIPQIPYMPSRNRESVFWHADRVLFAEPPLVFYLQAITVALFGEHLGSVRMASVCAGMVSLVLIYCLCREWFGSRRAGLLAALALSLSRGFYFPAMTARPDMAAIAFCLGAVLLMARQSQRERIPYRTCFGTGILLGLSLLTHPIGVVGVAQQSLWLCWKERRGFAWFGRLSTMALGTMLAISPITLLILAFQEEFLVQFGNNIFKPGSSNVTASLLHPLEITRYQLGHYLGQMTLWQGWLLIVAGLAAACGPRTQGLGHYRYTVISTPILVSFALGHHPVWGYYVYYVAIFCGGLGRLVDLGLAKGLHRPDLPAISAVRCAVGVLVVVLPLLPGAGLRTTWAHLRNWQNPSYDADAFTDSVLADIPPAAGLTAHEEMIIHTWLRRPDTVLGIVIPRYFDVTEYEGPLDYALLRPNDEKRTAERIGQLEPVRVYGDVTDIFSLKTQLYRIESVE